MKKKVFLVDDHPIVRQGFSLLINRQPDLEVCGEAEDAACAVNLILAVRPDIALIDISLKSGTGLELVKNVSAYDKSILMLAVSLHDESVYAERVLSAGAKGFIMKTETTENILLAIRSVLQGRIYLSERMQSRIMASYFGAAGSARRSPVESLSDRELEIFSLIAGGLSTKAIAEKLSLGVKTVETHKSHIKVKLGLLSGTELVRFAVRWDAESQR